MKRKIFTVIFCLVAIYQMEAQSDTSKLISAGWGNLDFAVPESPAFQILGTSPDNILKPTSVKAATISIGNYFLTNGPIIPKTLAVEFSPMLLANSKVSLFKYNNNKFWYRLRFSLGTASQQNGSYSVAEGVRFNIIDKTDLRTNPAFNTYIGVLLRNGAVNKAAIINEHIKELDNIAGGDFHKFLNDDGKDSVILKKCNDFINEIMQKSNDSSIAKEISQIGAYRDQKRNILWNQPIWDLGIAAQQSSPDSLITNLKFSQVGLWTSAGFPLFKTSGQLLLGGKLSIVDSVSRQLNASVGARFFYGSNNVKGYLQVQYDYKNELNSMTASLGCQFNISSGLWGQLNLNLIIKDGKVSYQPGFNIGLGTSEKKKS